MNLNYVMFDITNKCNFKCKHCYKEQSINTTDLNYNIIVSFLEQAKSNGYFPKVILSGGEPLMYRDLYKLLDLISIDHAIRLNTNSYFLYQHYLKLLKYKNLEVQISLDGYDDESYYGIRNNDCFERILKNSIAAHEAGLKIFLEVLLLIKQ